MDSIITVAEKLARPLRIDEIEFRIQSINKGGYATILAYKNARVDMARLDEAVTPFGWKREHSRDNHNCTVSIWSEELGQWVSKEDTGAESNQAAQKGLASDSFKRACFNWGIGRELYSYPVIQIKLNQDEFVFDGNRVEKTWKLKLKEWAWYAEWDGGEIAFLAARDEKQTTRFQWGVRNAK